MKILIDAHLFDDNFHQGSRTYLRELYNELILKSPEFSFYFVSSNLTLLKTEIKSNPNVFFVKLFWRNKFLRLLIEIPYLIFRHKIDFAHFQYISPPIKLAKEVVTIHDVLFIDFPHFFPKKYRLVNNFLFKNSAKRADILLTVSGYSKAAIAKHYNVDLDKIDVTPNAVCRSANSKVKLTDLLFKEKYGLKKYILYVSRIEPRKNHILLLKVFYDLNLWERGFQLVFIGQKSLRSQVLNSYWDSLDQKIKKEIIHLESIREEDLNLFYSYCSLFIYPSFAEGFGIPPLEAIANHAQVLCSNQTAMAEFDFLNSNMFDPYDYEAFKIKVEDALANPPMKQQRDILKESMQNKFSWAFSSNVLRNRLLSFYKS